MIILGIDPGSTRIGYGVIDVNKTVRLIDYGTIENTRQDDYAQLTMQVAEKISDLLDKYRPLLAGIEKLYFVKNIKTGIEVAQMRGVIILEIAKHRIPIREFNPLEIKQSVTNYGFADKKAVAKMVKKILNIKELEGFDDASDALAVAITTATRKKLASVKNESSVGD